MGTILFLGLFLFLFFIGVSGIRVIKQQSVAVVETLGKFSSTLSPGLNWIFFPFQRVAAVLELRIIEIKNEISVKTQDNQFVELPVSIMVKVNANKVSDAFYQLKNPQEQISTWVLNSIRAISAKMSLDALYLDRTNIVDEVQNLLAVKLDSYGYILETVLVDQPTLTKDVQHSFNRVIAAKREQEAAIQEASAQKIKIVANAEAEAEAQKKRAQGLAESREILARGLAESLKTLENKVESKEAIEVLLATNRIDALRDVAKSGNLILADLSDPSSILRNSMLANLKSNHLNNENKKECEN